MKNRFTLFVVLPFFMLNGHAQDNSFSNRSLDLKSRYDSAKVEFENYEKKHGGFVQTENVDLHYLEWGDPADTPLIWIHGSFTNSYELSGIADDLVEKGYYLVAIDYYGHGLTKIPGHEVSLYHVADDINTLMQVKKIKKAVIGGWSRGGIIATAFYDEYPGKVLGLLLEDGGSVSTNTHYHKMEEVELRRRMKEIFKDRISYPVFDSQFEAYQSFYNYDGGGTQFKLLAWLREDPKGKWSIGTGIEDLFSMADEEQFLDTILRPTKATLFGQSMAIIEPQIVYRDLDVPMLILDPVSDGDLFPYEKENEQLQNAHPRLITHKIYKDTGHNIHYERPREFVEDVGEFLGVVNDHWSKRTVYNER